MAKNFDARTVLLALVIILLLAGCAGRQTHPAIRQEASAGAKHPFIANIIKEASEGVLDGAFISNKLLEKASLMNKQDKVVLPAKTHFTWAVLFDVTKPPAEKIQGIYKASRGGYQLQNDTELYIVEIATHRFVLQRKANQLMIGELSSVPINSSLRPATSLPPAVPKTSRLKPQVLLARAGDEALLTAPARQGAWQAEQSAQQARQEALHYTKMKRSIVVNTGLGLSTLAAGLLLPQQPVLAIGLSAFQILYNLWEWWPDNDTGSRQPR